MHIILYTRAFNFYKNIFFCNCSNQPVLGSKFHAKEILMYLPKMQRKPPRFMECICCILEIWSHMLTKIMRVVYQYGGLQEKHALMLGIPSNRWKKELKEQSLLLNAAIWKRYSNCVLFSQNTSEWLHSADYTDWKP